MRNVEQLKLCAWAIVAAAAAVGCSSSSNTGNAGAGSDAGISDANVDAPGDGGGGGGTSDAEDAEIDATAGVSRFDQAVMAAGTFTSPPAAHDEEPVGSPQSTSVTYGDDSTWHCTVQHVSVQSDPTEFVTLDPTADVIFPGSLVQGASLEGGSPAPIAVKRGPGTIVLNLVTGQGGQSFQRTLTEVTQGNVVDAENEMLSGLAGTAIPAKYVYDYSLFDSAEKFAMAIGVKASWLGGSSLSGAASISTSKRQTEAVIRLTQQYFTVAYQLPTSIDELFDPSVNSADLAPFIGPGNPPAYISSVTYGRQFYLVFKSSASSTELAAAVQAIYSGLVVDVDGHMSSELARTQQQTSVEAYAIGGASDAALQVAVAASNNATDSSGLFAKLADYLHTGGTFSTDNPGLPVSYAIRDVATRQQVQLNLGSEYDVQKCQPVVNVKRLMLDLDANQAVTGPQDYDPTSGNCKCASTLQSCSGSTACNCNGSPDTVTSWPGSTTQQNAPTAVNDLVVATDSAGKKWVKMTNDSFAAGMDCGFMTNGDYTIAAVVKPIVPDPTPGQISLFLTAGSGGAATSTTDPKDQLLQIGWNDPTKLLHGHYSDDAAFSLAPQSGGHVIVTMYSQSSGVTTYANGVPAAPIGSAMIGALKDASFCMLGASWNEWAAFHQSSYGAAGATSIVNCSSFRGQIGEVQGYTTGLEEAERRVLECSLGQKWNINVAGCVNGAPTETW